MGIPFYIQIEFQLKKGLAPWSGDKECNRIHNYSYSFLNSVKTASISIRTDKVQSYNLNTIL